MLLPINEQYRLAADSHGWMIEEKRIRKRRGIRRTEWTPIRWYPTLTQAVENYAEFRLRVSDAQNVAEALSEVKRIAAELCEALRPMQHAIDHLCIRNAKANEAK